MTSPENPPFSPRRYLSMLLFYVGFALWFGAIALFGAAVAPVLFGILTRDLAGDVNVAILSRLNIIEFVAAFLILAGLLLRPGHSPSAKKWPSLVPAFVMLFLLCSYAGPISESMLDLRAQISSFDATPVNELPQKEAFNNLHRWYSRLVGINMGLALILFCWQTYLYTLPRGSGAGAGLRWLMQTLKISSPDDRI